MREQYDDSDGTQDGVDGAVRPTIAAEEIWRYFDEFKVYTENTALKDRIASWEGCRVSNRYYNRRGQLFAWDLIFPRRLHDRVAELCGLPLRKKAPGRVAQGKRLGARAKRLGYVGVKQQGGFPIVDLAQTRRKGQTTLASSPRDGVRSQCRAGLISSGCL